MMTQAPDSVRNSARRRHTFDIVAGHEWGDCADAVGRGDQEACKMTWSRWRAVLAVGLSLGAGARAEGPSFDCGVASAPIERVICGDAGLAAADASMATAYAALR